MRKMIEIVSLSACRSVSRKKEGEKCPSQKVVQKTEIFVIFQFADQLCLATNIEVYMANHQHDANASALWRYFQDVISWIKATFPYYRKEMKGIGWGALYNKYKDVVYNTKELEMKLLELIDDEEVQSGKGIYLYILTEEKKHLNLRQFDDKTKRRVYERQKGICLKCNSSLNMTKWKEIM
jgi:hypothetical protein